MPDSPIMKKAIVIFLILLIGGAWTANKYVTRANKNSEELERFQEYASNYNYDAEIFLTEQVKHHHDEAFAASYRMWKLSPISEIDLSSHYDQKAYYMTLGKIFNEKAKAGGQTDARNALIDIGKHYGVPPTPKNAPKTPAPATKNANGTDTSKSNRPKLGDKRAIPNSRRDEDR